MRKSEMNNLVAGVKLQSKKDNTILEIVGLDKEQGKTIMDNGKVYSFSTIYRWFDLYVEEVEQPEQPKEVVEDKPVQPKFKLGDTVKNGLGQIGEVVSVPHLVSYNGRLVMDGYRVRFTDDGETFVKSYSETYEGLTKVEEPVQPVQPTITEEKTVANENHEDHTVEANSNVLAGKNNIEDIFYRFSKVLDDHNCYFKKYKQYIGVLTDRKKGTLLQVRPNRQGNVNIDIKRGIWEKLKEQYRHLLEQQYGAKLYDKSRGYIRIFNMEDVNTFTILLLTALS